MGQPLIKQALEKAGSLETLLRSLRPEQVEELLYSWDVWARPEQLEPPGDWATWLYLAGRGTGKSCTGAATVRKWAMQHPGCKIALVARTAADVRDVMLSALMNPWRNGKLRPHEIPTHEPSNRAIRWPNGSFAITYTAEEPNALRGPQHDFAWCDELAAWQYPEKVWNEGIQMGMRGSGLPGVLVGRPRVIVTTTPRPIDLLKKLIKQSNVYITKGSTFDNADNLPAAYLKVMQEEYEGTRLGRQELHAELLDDVPGALWNYGLIEKSRVSTPVHLRRIVVGVDPAGSAKKTADTAGIVVCGIGECLCLGRKEMHGFVLEDLSGKYSSLDWGEIAINAYYKWNAQRIVIEDNFGGDTVTTVVELLDKRVSKKAVHAKQGKRTRAEPIAAMYEKGRVHHVGLHKSLEDELCKFDPLISVESPGRLDAMVWALTDLMLGPSRASFGDKAWKGPQFTFGNIQSDGMDWDE